MSFEAKTILITGASSGIGAEFAKQLHMQGAKVVLVARREELIKEQAEKFNNLKTNSAEYISADLTKTADLQRVVKFINEKHVDILINNAGRGSFGCFDELDLEVELDMISLNITATAQLAHAVIPQMKARRQGGIISVSSIAAFQTLPFMAMYAATKSFNFFHSMALREELADFNVKVLTLCPGPTATEFGGVARVPGKLTGGKRDKVEHVVADSLKAFQSNRAFVVPGLRSKGISYISRFLPKVFTNYVAGRILRSSLHKS